LENFIKKISNAISLVLLFILSSVFYFSAKGFVVENGQIVLKEQVVHAEDIRNGIAVVLPKNININASTKYVMGNKSAPLTLYEYSSFGCPHCADFHLNVLPKLERDYMEKGLLKVVFVSFPLDKKSMKGAMLSRCMTYDNYYQFIETLFDKQRFWFLAGDDTPLFKFAAEYGVSYDEAEACVRDNQVASEIIADRQQALKQLKIDGTPAFLVSGADGNEVIYGKPKYSDLQKYLDTRLAGLSH
jgi:protein-disulfide isomerase